jgi:signal transduction histidine kinase
MENNSYDELTMNQVKIVEKLQQQLKQQEKLASLGMLSAGIAHEIQNPLNFVINFSKMSEKLMKELTEIIDDNKDKLPEDDRMDVEDIVSDLMENMDKIIEHGERAISIIQGILLVSRGKENEFIPSDVNHLVKEYVWLSYHAMRAKDKRFNISIHEEYQEDIPEVMVIPQDLSRAILNLMNNACYAVYQRSLQEGSDYKPTITIKTAVADGQLCIIIADNGEGMNDEVKQRLYENFFTTKPIGHGTGLGMAITKDIIENKHGGKLSFETTLGKGTSFTMTIPIKK